MASDEPIPQTSYLAGNYRFTVIFYHEKSGGVRADIIGWSPPFLQREAPGQPAPERQFLPDESVTGETLEAVVKQCEARIREIAGEDPRKIPISGDE